MKQINWEAVLEQLQDELRDNMRMERQCDPDDKRNPYTFQAFYLREKIGLIEQENYEEAYRLLVEEYGEEFFDDFFA